MWSCDYFGRKVNIQLGAALSVLGGAFQGGAAALAMFQVGRFISGLGIGILVTVCPMYLSEMSSPFVRGFMVGYHAIFLVFGYMLSAWLGYGCYWATAANPNFAWRFPLCMQCLAPALLLAGSPWVPRSPRWLISKDKLEEAMTVLTRLRQSPDDPDNLVAREEFYQISEQLKLDQQKLKSTGYGVWSAVWKKKSYRKRMFMGFMIQFGAEVSGPLIINNYAVILYTNLGQTGGMPLLLSAVWLTTAGLIYNPGGAWLHDKVNSRRWMFMSMLVPQIESATVLVIYFYFPETARLTLEEIAQIFGDDVAVHITDASQEEQYKLEKVIEQHERGIPDAQASVEPVGKTV
ncbi:hypothetical protein LTR56_004553 [Elasticomyces elasticus]|nr:hypothetical protein LTR56_004553 [Elasticomyces elasticus]KAK3659927.1 hypothetical protein LTR22_008294 [Elasticomyces elasticus]KAK4904807.1 hypothetical protein LTR49_025812 [Elasticomyces elasticus]KAK5768129.1 hypothetical protein LTS12_001613 [Elasticomyces elasticus]